MDVALENVKVLDLTRVLAGPYATMILGDLGADIIKVEMPGKGDDARAFGPYVNEESAYFMSLNRNKRSITLNLKEEEGKRILRDMIKKVDVVVENFRPGTMEKLGLGYEDLKKINPKIVYAAASGFGHTGPYSKRAAYDAVVQAMGGIMSITGQENGKPTRVGTSVGDINAGMFTAIGILSALYRVKETGKGQKVDVAMLDSQVAILENAIARHVVTGEIPAPKGNRHPAIVPFETFETTDGDIMIAAGNDALWAKLCKAMELGELIDDPKYKTNPLRNTNYHSLKGILEYTTKKKSTAEWQEILDGAGVPNGPINTIDKVIEDPQVKAREMILEMDHPTAGKLRVPGIPVKLSDTPGQIRCAAPTLGQHTDEIMREYFEYSDEEIEKLRKTKVL